MPFTLQKKIKVEELNEHQQQRVLALLGRPPRGLLAMSPLRESGEPAVLWVDLIVDDKPFPTTFWLVEPGICYWLDGLEARGVIQELQRLIDHDPAMQRSMKDYHHWYIKQREAHGSPAGRSRLKALGFESSLRAKGVGGLGNFSYVRCLHTWYAAHLVKPNPVGQWLDDHESHCFKDALR